jgi:hypothetical protein
MADAQPPYADASLVADYLVNPDIKGYNLYGKRVHPLSLNKVFTPGSWAALYVVPTL